MPITPCLLLQGAEING